LRRMGLSRERGYEMWRPSLSTEGEGNTNTIAMRDSAWLTTIILSG
jgi:hypothetical protein